MKKLISSLLCFMLLISLVPMTVLAEEEPWSNEFSRIMDITDSLTKAEIQRLDDASMEILRELHVDVAIAAIPEARLQGQEMAEFAAGLYESCDFGYGDGKDGFLCLYLEDTQVLAIVPMGGTAGVLPQAYLEFMEQRIPSLRENNGVYGIFYGCQELIRSGLEIQAEKAAFKTEPESSSFARVGEGSDKPAWFPANLDEAYVYFDANAPRIVDYAHILSEEAKAAMAARIAEITALTGKDIVIVTDVSNYSLGDDIYAADFYDYNGYGIGQEHEGILLFLNLDPENRGGWTVETGSETRALATYSAVNRLDDFLYAALASGEYERALTEWIEDVYSVFTTGIARPAFWYHPDGEMSRDFDASGASAVVDEWGLLNEEQTAALQAKAREMKETYSVNVYFHTTGDRMGMARQEYNNLYMTSMGYEKDAVLFTIENSGGDTVKYSYVYLYGSMKERVPEKFRSRIENNASAAGDSFGRLLEGQRLLASYLENGRVPRNGFYWTMITLLSTAVGFIGGLVSLSSADDSMETVRQRTSAYSYLDRSKTKVQRIREVLLYVTTSRVYIPPKDTDSGSRSSGGSSSYKSSYTGHSGVSHTGHGRKF